MTLYLASIICHRRYNFVFPQNLLNSATAESVEGEKSYSRHVWFFVHLPQYWKFNTLSVKLKKSFGFFFPVNRVPPFLLRRIQRQQGTCSPACPPQANWFLVSWVAGDCGTVWQRSRRGLCSILSRGSPEIFKVAGKNDVKIEKRPNCLIEFIATIHCQAWWKLPLLQRKIVFSLTVYTNRTIQEGGLLPRQRQEEI